MYGKRILGKTYFVRRSALETKDITHFDPTGIALNGLGQENPA